MLDTRRSLIWTFGRACACFSRPTPDRDHTSAFWLCHWLRNSWTDLHDRSSIWWARSNTCLVSACTCSCALGLGLIRVRAGLGLGLAWKPRRWTRATKRSIADVDRAELHSQVRYSLVRCVFDSDLDAHARTRPQLTTRAATRLQINPSSSTGIKPRFPVVRCRLACLQPTHCWLLWLGWWWGKANPLSNTTTKAAVIPNKLVTCVYDILRHWQHK